VLILILASYALARILEIVPSTLPRTAIVALDVLSAMAFALLDGARNYRLRGILIFAAICIVVGNLVENLGVTTGFPFGRYYFVNLMGPKLLHVPVLLGLAYIGMAYVSWNVALAILGPAANSASGLELLKAPILASFIMTAWDLAQDPVWATMLHGWIWLDGGLWFGVPVSNYLGWLGTVFVIFLLFTLYLRRRPQVPAPTPNSRPALLFYALCAACNVLQVLPAPVPAVVQDPTGRAWRVADITGASALVSIFVMGSFAALAWVRMARRERDAID
jgi:putative membrane protein